MEQKIKSVSELQEGSKYIRLYINYRGEARANVYTAVSKVYKHGDESNKNDVIDMLLSDAPPVLFERYYVEDLGINCVDGKDELAFSSTGLYEYKDTLWSYIDGLMTNRMAVYEFLENKTCTKEQKIQLYLNWIVATIVDLNNWIFSEGKDRLAYHYKGLTTELNQFL